MLGTGSEVPTMEISKYALGADEWRRKRAVPGVDSLPATEQEQN